MRYCVTKTIAITGKGGTGKTAVSALMIRSLSKKGKSILAVDADADTNLPGMQKKLFRLKLQNRGLIIPI
jgi:CO dehydrogenase maturation factor